MTQSITPHSKSVSFVDTKPVKDLSLSPLHGRVQHQRDARSLFTPAEITYVRKEQMRPLSEDERVRLKRETSPLFDILLRLRMIFNEQLYLGGCLVDYIIDPTQEYRTIDLHLPITIRAKDREEAQRLITEKMEHLLQVQFREIVAAFPEGMSPCSFEKSDDNRSSILKFGNIKIQCAFDIELTEGEKVIFHPAFNPYFSRNALRIPLDARLLHRTKETPLISLGKHVERVVASIVSRELEQISTHPMMLFEWLELVTLRGYSSFPRDLRSTILRCYLARFSLSDLAGHFNNYFSKFPLWQQKACQTTLSLLLKEADMSEPTIQANRVMLPFLILKNYFFSSELFDALIAFLQIKDHLNKYLALPTELQTIKLNASQDDFIAKVVRKALPLLHSDEKIALYYYLAIHHEATFDALGLGSKLKDLQKRPLITYEWLGIKEISTLNANECLDLIRKMSKLHHPCLEVMKRAQEIIFSETDAAVAYQLWSAIIWPTHEERINTFVYIVSIADKALIDELWRVANTQKLIENSLVVAAFLQSSHLFSLEMNAALLKFSLNKDFKHQEALNHFLLKFKGNKEMAYRVLVLLRSFNHKEVNTKIAATIDEFFVLVCQENTFLRYREFKGLASPAKQSEVFSQIASRILKTADFTDEKLNFLKKEAPRHKENRCVEIADALLEQYCSLNGSGTPIEQIEDLTNALRNFHEALELLVLSKVHIESDPSRLSASLDTLKNLFAQLERLDLTRVTFDVIKNCKVLLDLFLLERHPVDYLLCCHRFVRACTHSQKQKIVEYASQVIKDHVNARVYEPQLYQKSVYLLLREKSDPYSFFNECLALGIYIKNENSMMLLMALKVIIKSFGSGQAQELALILSDRDYSNVLIRSNISDCSLFPLYAEASTQMREKLRLQMIYRMLGVLLKQAGFNEDVFLRVIRVIQTFPLDSFTPQEFVAIKMIRTSKEYSDQLSEEGGNSCSLILANRLLRAANEHVLAIFKDPYFQRDVLGDKDLPIQYFLYFIIEGIDSQELNGLCLSLQVAASCFSEEIFEDLLEMVGRHPSVLSRVISLLYEFLCVRKLIQLLPDKFYQRVIKLFIAQGTFSDQKEATSTLILFLELLEKETQIIVDDFKPYMEQLKGVVEDRMLTYLIKQLESLGARTSC